jgi:hypothetical protein
VRRNHVFFALWIARNEQHADPRTRREHAFCHLGTALPWHGHVTQQHVDGACVRHDEVQRDASVLCGQNFVAEAFEQAARGLAYRVLVIDHQDATLAVLLDG